MRKAFIETITKLARVNKDIFLLTGDLGFSVFEKFQKEFVGRFFDVGVAEQNMIGIAAGLSLSGKTVFVYSIIPFITMRCLEQIRNDLCMQNLNVKIVGMGAGLHYGSAGPTHHAIEDISIMRSLPNMKVVCPSGPTDTESAIKAIIRCNGPVYIRLSHSDGLAEPLRKENFCLGEGVIVEKGNNIVIISTGNILYKTKEAIEILKKRGISVRLINMHTIKPIDKNIILKAAREIGIIFTVEEHCITGGLGSAVAEVLSDLNLKTLFKRLSLKDSFVKEAGDREHLLEKNKLSSKKIANTILKHLNDHRR